MSRKDQYINLRYPTDAKATVDAYRKLVLHRTGRYPGTTEAILEMINKAAQAAVKEARQ